jgi:hypothetical protein
LQLHIDRGFVTVVTVQPHTIVLLADVAQHIALGFLHCVVTDFRIHSDFKLRKKRSVGALSQQLLPIKVSGIIRPLHWQSHQLCEGQILHQLARSGLHNRWIDVVNLCGGNALQMGSSGNAWINIKTRINANWHLQNFTSAFVNSFLVIYWR